jgi:hypothetical protein
MPGKPSKKKQKTGSKEQIEDTGEGKIVIMI